MMEALLMGGGLLGPASAWTFVGVVNLISGGTGPAQPKFHGAIQPGDLVIGLMSPLYETEAVTMTTAGWETWGTRSHDYACAARYTPDLLPPKWEKVRANSLYVSLLVFRAPGWSTVRLEAQNAPAIPVNVDVQANNQLLLSIGITPGTTRSWVGHMPGEVATARVQRANAPALQVYSATVASPRQVSGIYVDAASGSERNLLISAF